VLPAGERAPLGRARVEAHGPLVGYGHEPCGQAQRERESGLSQPHRGAG
jgi:hypothetical protein